MEGNEMKENIILRKATNAKNHAPSSSEMEQSCDCLQTPIQAVNLTLPMKHLCFPCALSHFYMELQMWMGISQLRHSWQQRLSRPLRRCPQMKYRNMQCKQGFLSLDSRKQTASFNKRTLMTQGC